MVRVDRERRRAAQMNMFPKEELREDGRRAVR
jgi:hypothetical protein